VTERPFPERSAARTDQGRRRANQDAVVVAQLSDGAELAAVADGMGGHSAGEIASRRALEVLHAEVAAGRDLVTAVATANATIFREASTVPNHEGMGTTLVALLRRGGQYTVANVGDSRAYRLDAAGLAQLSEDHSFVAEAVRSGQLSAAEAARSRWRHAVTRALGTESDVEVDVYGPFDAQEPHAVLLCSDGLHRALPDDDVHDIIVRAAQLELAARELITAAFEAGSDDNISVALIAFGQPVEAPQAQPSSAMVDHNRPRRPKPSHRWTLIRTSVIFLSFIAVIVFVALLTLAL
jgi:PPM family protein phosphatase